MNEPDNNRSIEIKESAVGSAIVSGDGNTTYVIQQATEQNRVETEPQGVDNLGPNPYKGLAAFKESDADRYYGREAQIERLWQRFQSLYEQSDAPRFLPILGPSGCGKSSLARAGFIPELARKPLPGKEHMRVAVPVPRARPLEALAGVLAKAVTEDLSRDGGVGGALAGEAQKTYDRLSEAEKSIAQRVFVGLVQLGAGTRDTRRRVIVKSLIAKQDTPETVR